MQAHTDTSTVSVEFCRACYTHNWCTHHDEEKYLTYFEKLSLHINNHFPQLKVVGNSIPKHLQPLNGTEVKFYNSKTKKYVNFPGIGAFQITFRGQLLFSKKKSNTWPDFNNIIEKISNVISPERQIQDNSHFTEHAQFLEEQSQQLNNVEQQTDRETMTFMTNEEIDNQDKRTTFYAKRPVKNFTLTDHFKIYKMSKKNQQKDKKLLQRQQKSEPSHTFTKIDSNESKTSRKNWDNISLKNQLPSFIKQKAYYINEQKGKRQMIINLDSIQQQTFIDENVSKRQKQNQRCKSRQVMRKWDEQLNFVQHKFKKVENSLSKFKQKNKQFDTSMISLQGEWLQKMANAQNQNKVQEYKFMPNFTNSRIQQQHFSPQQSRALLHQLRYNYEISPKLQQIHKYIHSSTAYKNKRLHEIYGQQKLLKKDMDIQPRYLQPKKKYADSDSQSEQKVKKIKRWRRSNDKQIQFPEIQRKKIRKQINKNDMIQKIKLFKQIQSQHEQERAKRATKRTNKSKSKINNEGTEEDDKTFQKSQIDKNSVKTSPKLSPKLKNNYRFKRVEFSDQKNADLSSNEKRSRFIKNILNLNGFKQKQSIISKNNQLNRNSNDGSQQKGNVFSSTRTTKKQLPSSNANSHPKNINVQKSKFNWFSQIKDRKEPSKLNGLEKKIGIYKISQHLQQQEKSDDKSQQNWLQELKQQQKESGNKQNERRVKTQQIPFRQRSQLKKELENENRQGVAKNSVHTSKQCGSAKQIKFQIKERNEQIQQNPNNKLLQPISVSHRPKNIANQSIQTIEKVKNNNLKLDNSKDLQITITPQQNSKELQQKRFTNQLLISQGPKQNDEQKIKNIQTCEDNKSFKTIVQLKSKQLNYEQTQLFNQEFDAREDIISENKTPQQLAKQCLSKEEKNCLTNNIVSKHKQCFQQTVMEQQQYLNEQKNLNESKNKDFHIERQNKDNTKQNDSEIQKIQVKNKNVSLKPSHQVNIQIKGVQVQANRQLKGENKKQQKSVICDKQQIKDEESKPILQVNQKIQKMAQKQEQNLQKIQVKQQSIPNVVEQSKVLQQECNQSQNQRQKMNQKSNQKESEIKKTMKDGENGEQVKLGIKSKQQMGQKEDNKVKVKTLREIEQNKLQEQQQRMNLQQEIADTALQTMERQGNIKDLQAENAMIYDEQMGQNEVISAQSCCKEFQKQVPIEINRNRQESLEIGEQPVSQNRKDINKNQQYLDCHKKNKEIGLQQTHKRELQTQHNEGINKPAVEEKQAEYRNQIKQVYQQATRSKSTPNTGEHIEEKVKHTKDVQHKQILEQTIGQQDSKQDSKQENIYGKQVEVNQINEQVKQNKIEGIKKQSQHNIGTKNNHKQICRHEQQERKSMKQKEGAIEQVGEEQCKGQNKQEEINGLAKTDSRQTEQKQTNCKQLCGKSQHPQQQQAIKQASLLPQNSSDIKSLQQSSMQKGPIQKRNSQTKPQGIVQAIDNKQAVQKQPTQIISSIPMKPDEQANKRGDEQLQNNYLKSKTAAKVCSASEFKQNENIINSNAIQSSNEQNKMDTMEPKSIQPTFSQKNEAQQIASQQKNIQKQQQVSSRKSQHTVTQYIEQNTLSEQNKINNQGQKSKFLQQQNTQISCKQQKYLQKQQITQTDAKKMRKQQILNADSQSKQNQIRIQTISQQKSNFELVQKGNEIGVASDQTRNKIEHAIQSGNENENEHKNDEKLQLKQINNTQMQISKQCQNKSQEGMIQLKQQQAKGKKQVISSSLANQQQYSFASSSNNQIQKLQQPCTEGENKVNQAQHATSILQKPYQQLELAIQNNNGDAVKQLQQGKLLSNQTNKGGNRADEQSAKSSKIQLARQQPNNISSQIKQVKQPTGQTKLQDISQQRVGKQGAQQLKRASKQQTKPTKSMQSSKLQHNKQNKIQHQKISNKQKQQQSKKVTQQLKRKDGLQLQLAKDNKTVDSKEMGENNNNQQCLLVQKAKTKAQANEIIQAAGNQSKQSKRAQYQSEAKNEIYEQERERVNQKLEDFSLQASQDKAKEFNCLQQKYKSKDSKEERVLDKLGNTEQKIVKKQQNEKSLQREEVKVQKLLVQKPTQQKQQSKTKPIQIKESKNQQYQILKDRKQVCSHQGNKDKLQKQQQLQMKLSQSVQSLDNPYKGEQLRQKEQPKSKALSQQQARLSDEKEQRKDKQSNIIKIEMVSVGVQKYDVEQIGLQISPQSFIEQCKPQSPVVRHMPKKNDIGKSAGVSNILYDEQQSGRTVSVNKMKQKYSKRNQQAIASQQSQKSKRFQGQRTYQAEEDNVNSYDQQLSSESQYQLMSEKKRKIQQFKGKTNENQNKKRPLLAKSKYMNKRQKQSQQSINAVQQQKQLENQQVQQQNANKAKHQAIISQNAMKNSKHKRNYRTFQVQQKQEVKSKAKLSKRESFDDKIQMLPITSNLNKEEQQKYQKPQRALITKQLYGSQNQEQKLKIKKYDFDESCKQKFASIQNIHKLFGRIPLFNRGNISCSSLTGGAYFSRGLQAALKILAHIDQNIIIRLFQNDKQSNPKNGLFGIWLCDHYVWKCFYIDGCIPVDRTMEPIGLTFKQYNQNQLWIYLLEKALAICIGGYELLESIETHQVLHMLTGSNVLSYKIRQDFEKNNKLFSTIKSCSGKNFFINCEKNQTNLKSIQKSYKKLDALYRIQNARIINNEQKVVQICEIKEEKQNRFWMRFDKFMQDFKLVQVLQLRMNHNNCRILLTNAKGTFSIACLNFQKDSLGSITISNRLKAGYIKVYLYKEEKSNTLKLVGEAKQKSKNQLFFDCYFNSGKYYVFVEVQHKGSFLSYLGQGYPTLELKEQIRVDGYKNDFTEYLPIHKQANKQNSRTNLKIYGTQFAQSKPQQRDKKSRAKSKIKETKLQQFEQLRENFISFLVQEAKK